MKASGEGIRSLALANIGRIQEAINGYSKRRPDLADHIYYPDNLVKSLQQAIVVTCEGDPFEEHLVIDEVYNLWLVGPYSASTEFNTPSCTAIPINNNEVLVVGLI